MLSRVGMGQRRCRCTFTLHCGRAGALPARMWAPGIGRMLSIRSTKQYRARFTVEFVVLSVPKIAIRTSIIVFRTVKQSMGGILIESRHHSIQKSKCDQKMV